MSLRQWIEIVTNTITKVHIPSHPNLPHLAPDSFQWFGLELQPLAPRYRHLLAFVPAKDQLLLFSYALIVVSKAQNIRQGWPQVPCVDQGLVKVWVTLYAVMEKISAA